MDRVENTYLLALGAMILVLMVCRLVRLTVSSITTQWVWLRGRSVRQIFLSCLVYPRLGERLLDDAMSPLAILLSIGFFASTGVLNIIGTNGVSEASSRAARLALMSLLPHFFSGGREFGARLLGVSLETYGLIHRVVGLMSVLQGTIHVVTASRIMKFDLAEDTQFYGLVAGCMLLSLLFIPIVKRRVYELFLKVHLATAMVALYAIWKHISPEAGYIRRLPVVYLAIFSVTGVLQTIRILFRNLVIGRQSVRMNIQPYAEDNVHVKLQLPRPWVIKAGERIILGAPSIGIFYFLQAHPFTITWWEEDSNGRATTLFLLFRARAGFTRKVVNFMQAHQGYRAWIDGPFGPATIYGSPSSHNIGDYGHILMATSGIGIATQIPYIKELLQRRHRAEVRTQRITLIWQLDRTGDWESAREWLQRLIKQDKDYILNITVYDPADSDSAQMSMEIGHHGLITVVGGLVDWGQVLSSEMNKQKGHLLVTVSARSQIRRSIQSHVRKNVQHNVELFELEFQPWSEGRDWWSFFTP